MVSKKVLLASICFIILLAAVGAYSYIEISMLGNHISDLENQIDTLQETVSSLEAERDSLQNNVSDLVEENENLWNTINAMNSTINEMNTTLNDLRSTRTFVFEWSWSKVVNGTLRMELTFTWRGENLSIIARINDGEYNAGDYLGLVFDLDGNGTLDEPGCMLFSDNTTLPGLLSDGFLFCPFLMDPYPSPYHTCVFEAGVGYTFNFSFPLSELGTPSDLIHVCFYDKAVNGGVYVRFHFGMDVS